MVDVPSFPCMKSYNYTFMECFDPKNIMSWYKTCNAWGDSATMSAGSRRSRMLLTVLLLSKQNKTFLRYFDPMNTIFYNKIA